MFRSHYKAPLLWAVGLVFIFSPVAYSQRNTPAPTNPTNFQQATEAPVNYEVAQVFDAQHCNTCNITPKKCCQNSLGGCVDWIITGRVLLLRRDLNDLSLLSEVDAGNAIELLNAGDFDFNRAVGIDVAAARGLSEGMGLQIRVVATESFSDTQQRTPANAANNVSIGFNRPRQIGDGTVSMSYNSAFASGELNLLVEEWRGLTWTAGLRIFELSEEMNFWSIESDAAFRINTDNFCHGVHIGGSGILGQWGRLRIDGFANGGIFLNWVDARFTASNDFLQPENVLQGHRDEIAELAFLSEFGVFASVELGPRRMISAGYQGMVLWGMSTASGQLPHTRTQAIGIGDITAFANEAVLLHGP